MSEGSDDTLMLYTSSSSSYSTWSNNNDKRFDGNHNNYNRKRKFNQLNDEEEEEEDVDLNHNINISTASNKRKRRSSVSSLILNTSNLKTSISRSLSPTSPSTSNKVRYSTSNTLRNSGRSLLFSNKSRSRSMSPILSPSKTIEHSNSKPSKSSTTQKNRKQTSLQKQTPFSIAKTKQYPTSTSTANKRRSSTSNAKTNRTKITTKEKKKKKNKKKQIHSTVKKEIYRFCIDIYNKIKPLLPTTSDTSQSIIFPDIAVPDQLNDFKAYPSSKKVIKKQQHITNGLSNLLHLIDTENNEEKTEYIVSSARECWVYLKKNHNDCIQKINGKLYKCTFCVKHFDQELWDQYGSRLGDSLATIGDPRFRWDRAYGHVNGIFHNSVMKPIYHDDDDDDASTSSED